MAALELEPLPPLSAGAHRGGRARPGARAAPGRPRLNGAQHVDGDPPLRLRQFEPVDAGGAAPEDVEVPAQLRAGFEQCVAELRGAPVPAARPPWARACRLEQAEDPWNVLGSTASDQSMIAVANPLHDVNHYLFNVADDERETLLEAYGEVCGADVRAAAQACEAETYEWIAQSYAQITAALAPDDRWWFADEEARRLGWASDVRAGRRPSRDT